VGGERDPERIARKIYDAIIERTKFIDGVCGRGVSILTFEQRIGRCDEFHALFRSMLMYKGVPASWEEGLILPYPSELKSEDSYEADCLRTISWVRFYNGRKWIPVDLAEAKRRPDLREFYFGKIPPNRIRLSRGRGFKLNPPQYEALSLFAYTHIEEEDGIPAIYGHHYRVRVGEKAPTFVLLDERDRKVDFGKFIDRPTIIYFTHNACHYCTEKGSQQIR